MTDTLDTRGAAELLHVSESTVQALARAGEIPATQLGGHWLFVRQDLLDTIRARAAEEQRDRRKTTLRLGYHWRRIAEKAGCVDLHFHDLRHEATCRLFERTTLTDTQISLITGHRDPRMLRRYANLRGSDLAARLW